MVEIFQLLFLFSPVPFVISIKIQYVSILRTLKSLSGSDLPFVFQTHILGLSCTVISTHPKLKSESPQSCTHSVFFSFYWHHHHLPCIQAQNQLTYIIYNHPESSQFFLHNASCSHSFLFTPALRFTFTITIIFCVVFLPHHTLHHHWIDIS